MTQGNSDLNSEVCNVRALTCFRRKVNSFCSLGYELMKPWAAAGFIAFVFFVWRCTPLTVPCLCSCARACRKPECTAKRWCVIDHDRRRALEWRVAWQVLCSSASAAWAWACRSRGTRSFCRKPVPPVDWAVNHGPRRSMHNTTT